MKAQELKINLSKLIALNLSGKGGKEALFQDALGDNWNRDDCRLFDFSSDVLDTLLEFKKQKNLQWLDPSKYHSLTDKEKDILVLFVLLNSKGKPDTVFTVRTGDFVQRLWTEEETRDAWNYIQKHPKHQIKCGVKMRDWLDSNRDIANMLYLSPDRKKKANKRKRKIQNCKAPETNQKPSAHNKD